MKQLIFYVALILNFKSDAWKIQKRAALESKNSEVKHWGYRNQDKSILPSNWHETHPKCYGKQQSPINVESHETFYDKNLTKISITSEFKTVKRESDWKKEKWSIKNNGHSGNLKSRIYSNLLFYCKKIFKSGRYAYK